MSEWFKRIIAFLALFAPVNLAVATNVDPEKSLEPITYWTTGEFSVMSLPDSDYCVLVGVNDYNESLFIRYFHADDEYNVLMSNNQATSRNDGEIVRLTPFFNEVTDRPPSAASYDFEVRMLNDDIVFDGWVKTRTVDSVFPRAKRFGFGRKNSAGNFVAVAQFTYNDGSEAIAKLRECAFKQSGLNPNDPFLQ